jgi:hypothetical protein
MSASGGAKRRRRRERRFLDFHDAFSLRASIVAVLATGGFLVLQIARTFFKA